MRKISTFLLTLLLSISLVTNIVKAQSTPPKVSADGVVLMDATTGKILYSKNKDSKYPPASTTKILTALLALENCNLDEVVTVGKNPPLVTGSRIYIFEGEKLTIRDLLYALLLQSANDCAEAIAEHISGSVGEFAKLMNKRALELGCKNSNFINPHGLYNENHRTSAYDLALILKELIKYPEYKKISTTSMYYINPTNKSKEKRPIWNKNKLIQKNSKYYYNGCEGGKTGYTVQSKHSYVAAASKGNQKLLAILLHDTKHTYWCDVGKLFDYGFKNFTLETFHLQGDSLGNYSINKDTQIPISSGENFYYVKENNSKEGPKLNILSKDLSKTSFKKGDTILDSNVMYNNEVIGTLKIMSGTNYVAKKSLFPLNTQKNIYSFLIKKSSYILGGVFILFLILKALKFRRNKHSYKHNKHQKR